MSNHIAEVTSEDFRPLSTHRIELLDLSKNKFISLPDNVFMHLVFLTTLTLSQNNMIHFNFNSLLGMASLQKLDVLSCGIRNISGFPDDALNKSQVIPPLKTLIIGQNSLRLLPSKGFSGLVKLVQLDLKENRIKYLANDSFRGLVSLKMLNLRNNRMESVNSDVFWYTPSLYVLDLSKNNFKILSPAQLRDFKRLESLDFAENAIN